MKTLKKTVSMPHLIDARRLPIQLLIWQTMEFCQPVLQKHNLRFLHVVPIQMSFGKRTESVHAARPGPGRPGDISPAPVGCIGPLNRPRPGALPLNLSPWKRQVPEQCDTTDTRATKEAPVQPSRASSRRPNLPMLIPGILIRRPVIRRLCLQH